jgi:hypothetical protein
LLPEQTVCGSFLWLANRVLPEDHRRPQHQSSIATLTRHITIYTSSHFPQPCKIRLSIQLDLYVLLLATFQRHTSTPFVPSILYQVGPSTTNSHFPYLIAYATAHLVATPPHGLNTLNCQRLRPPRTLDEALAVSPHPLIPLDPTQTRVLSSEQEAAHAILVHAGAQGPSSGRNRARLHNLPPQVVHLKRTYTGCTESFHRP